MMRKRIPGFTASDRRVERAIQLLGLLSSVDGGIVSSAEAAEHLGCTDDELDEPIALIATLADRESGARAVIYRDHGDIVLEGAPSRLLPLRLSTAEGAVLAAVLEDLSIPEDARGRLSRALLPPDMRSTPPRAASTTVFGRHFPAIARAIDTQTAIAIMYRSNDDATARERVVLPQGFDQVAGVAYLLGVDRDKREPRRYRLERIQAVRVVEAQSHGDELPACDGSGRADHTSIRDSLARASVQATIRVSPDAPVPTWSGIQGMAKLPDGSTELIVGVASKPWLFDQVLAAGGAYRIVEPCSLAQELATYARRLAEER